MRHVVPTLGAFGEDGHAHHHAFPGPARFGLYSGQADSGWRVLWALDNMGWIWNVTMPSALPPREVLQVLEEDAERVQRIREAAVSL